VINRACTGFSGPSGGKCVTLADIPSNAWAQVAVRVARPQYDVWVWSLSVDERGALYLARKAGRVVTVQKRGEDGRFRLLARRVVSRKNESVFAKQRNVTL
jgi:hypothetical protein